MTRSKSFWSLFMSAFVLLSIFDSVSPVASLDESAPSLRSRDLQDDVCDGVEEELLEIQVLVQHTGIPDNVTDEERTALEEAFTTSYNQVASQSCGEDGFRIIQNVTIVQDPGSGFTRIRPTSSATRQTSERRVDFSLLYRVFLRCVGCRSNPRLFLALSTRRLRELNKARREQEKAKKSSVKGQKQERSLLLTKKKQEEEPKSKISAEVEKSRDKLTMEAESAFQVIARQDDACQCAAPLVADFTETFNAIVQGLQTFGVLVNVDSVNEVFELEPVDCGDETEFESEVEVTHTGDGDAVQDSEIVALQDGFLSSYNNVNENNGNNCDPLFRVLDAVEIIPQEDPGDGDPGNRVFTYLYRTTGTCRGCGMRSNLFDDATRRSRLLSRKKRMLQGNSTNTCFCAVGAPDEPPEQEEFEDAFNEEQEELREEGILVNVESTENITETVMPTPSPAPTLPDTSLMPTPFPTLPFTFEPTPGLTPQPTPPPTPTPTPPPTRNPTRNPTRSPTPNPTPEPTPTVVPPTCSPFESIKNLPGAVFLDRLSDTDDSTENVTLPFTFMWFGDTPMNNIIVTSNGAIVMDISSTNTLCCTPHPIAIGGSGDELVPRISVVQEDLEPEDGGEIWTLDTGFSFIVSYEDTVFFGVDTIYFVNAQIELFPDGGVDLRYGNGTIPPSGVTGIAAGLEDDRRPQAIPATGEPFLEEGVTDREFPAFQCRSFRDFSLNITSSPSQAPSRSPEPSLSPSLSLEPSSQPSSAIPENCAPFVPLQDDPRSQFLGISTSAIQFELVELPFDFPWFGDPLTMLNEVHVSTAGVILTDPENVDHLCCTPLPIAVGGTGSQAVPRIAVAHGDLDPSLGGDIYTLDRGSSFVISWEGVVGAGEGIVFAQAVLFPTGRVDFAYGNGSAGSSFSFAAGLEDDRRPQALPAPGFPFNENGITQPGEYPLNECLSFSDFSTPAPTPTPTQACSFAQIQNEPGAVLSALSFTDNGFENVILPFTFKWLGVLDVTTVTLSSNGWILMDLDTPPFICCAAVAIDGTVPVPRISVAQGNLNPFEAGVIYTLDTGDSFVISYEDVSGPGSPGLTNAQAELFPDGTVEIRWGSGSLQNSNFAAGLEDFRFGQVLPATGAPFIAGGLTDFEYPANECRIFQDFGDVSFAPSPDPATFDFGTTSPTQAAVDTVTTSPTVSPSAATSEPTLIPTGVPTNASLRRK